MMDFSAPEVTGQLLKNESLSRYTSWRTGGPADYVYIPANVSDLALFLKQVPQHVPITWLGLGSNTLVRDGGIEGVVIVTQGALKQLEQLENGLIRAEAGVSSAQLARFSARLGTKGLEFLAGIPGTVGGALAMNAGCYGGETWKFVQTVETINRCGDIQHRPISDFKISYRHVELPPDEWFLAGCFQLEAGEKDHGLQTIKMLIQERNAAQPTGSLNCGSVFRNPTDHFAGRLIETCGLKGMQIGGAKVSEKHANFIINDTAAKSDDIETLIFHVQDTVYKKCGIRLIPEVHIIGRK